MPTVAIEDSTRRSINGACRKLKKIMARHPHKNDFSDEIIMKNRFGAGGRNVYKFKNGQPKIMMASMKKNNKISYIIQPFAKGDFRCNEHQGGLLKYISKSEVPLDVVIKSNALENKPMVSDYLITPNSRTSKYPLLLQDVRY